jgi:predicted transcriptional regulator of viral defense system
MDKIIEYFKKNHGYARLKDLKNKRVHTGTIRSLLNRGIIEKVKPGLYKLSGLPVMPETNMVEIRLSMPLAVVCLHSALRYYDLTGVEPPHLMVALPRESKPVNNLPQQVKVYFFAAKNHRVGIEEIESAAGTFRIYHPEKTIVDCFRYRNKLGLDLAIEGLKNYLAAFEHDTGKLIEYARFGRMFNVMKPYLDTLIRTG